MSRGLSRRRSRATSAHGFYGWYVVAFAAVTLAATAPGQTAAVSAFIDPMIHGLGVSREAMSAAYLAGTITGAAVLPLIGRTVDRFGTRRSMLLIGALFGAVLLLMSRVQGTAGLVLGFVGIRMLGQGSLSLCATNAAATWFERRRGTALGIVAAFGTAGISTAPLLLERFIAAHGWRTAWFAEGIALWAIVVPIAAFGIKDHPGVLGQHPDGVPHHERTGDDARWGLSRRDAVRTPFFWVVTAAATASGMLSTAVAFNQISLLGERGLTPAEAAANFLPQTAAGLAATFATGWLVDRAAPKFLVTGAMALLAGGLASGAFVRPGLSAVGFGMALGASGASIRALETAAIPRYFGTLHLGSIRGLIAAVNVGSTAFGPMLFAFVHARTGSYTPVLLVSAAAPAAVGLAALRVRAPSPPREPAEPTAAGVAPRGV